MMAGGKTSKELKEEGNTAFKAKEWKKALSLYGDALKAAGGDEIIAVAIHKNLAACHLKLEEYQRAVKCCDAALAIAPNDVKALYRRGVAHESLNNVDDAFKDMVRATQLDPKNSQAVNAARRLKDIVSAKVNEQRSTQGITAETLKRLLESDSLEERRKAGKNVVALANDTTGAEKLFQQGVITKILPLLEKEDEFVVYALRTYSFLCKNSIKRGLAVLQVLSSAAMGEKLMNLIKSKNIEIVRAAMSILSSLAEIMTTDEAKGNDDCLRSLDMVQKYLITLLPHKGIIAEARDAVLTAIMTNAPRGKFAIRFLNKRGVKTLVETAKCAQSPLVKNPELAEIAMSSGARMHLSVAIAKIHDATSKRGQSSQDFKDQCMTAVSFVDDPAANVGPTYALTTIIQAVPAIGNDLLEEADVMGHLMAMASSENKHAQCAAAEALAHAASDKKRARGIMVEGFVILKRLYDKDLPNAIRVRALVGLCKMSSQHSGLKGQKTFTEGSSVALAKKLRPFLVGDALEADTQRWAAEGLAYLTLDADVKEMIANDAEVMKAIHIVCCGAVDKTVQFAMAEMLVNMTNSYDKPDETEEREQLKKIGKFAGENIPEPHPKDANEYAEKRTKVLLDNDFVTAMVELAKTDSENAKEAVARVFLAMVEETEHRGKVVQQGGAKALLPLARENTDKGILKAAQALAKIGITSNPAFAFPGQRAAELVKPLIRLTRERNGLLQFEGAMALCNLASMNDDMRLRIVREKGISALEDLMFDPDVLVRRAGTEALLNMLYSEKVFNMFATKEGACWERLKLWILLAGVANEDYNTARAAAGGVAILSSSKEVCKRILEEKQGVSIMKELLVSQDADLQIRALHILTNMANFDKELVRPICDDEGLAMLSVIRHSSKSTPAKQATLKFMLKLVELKILENLVDADKAAARVAVSMHERKGEDDDDSDEEDEEDEEEEDINEVTDSNDKDKDVSKETSVKGASDASTTA